MTYLSAQTVPVARRGLAPVGRPRARGRDWALFGRAGQWNRGRAPALGDVGAIGQTFPAEVEAWRSLLSQYAGDISVPYLLAWITRESAGNPCSYTSAAESGIFQLMPPDNIAQAGTSLEALRAGCIGTTQQLSRELTDAERYEQVRSGLQYINVMRQIAHQKLGAAGVDWPESSPDFWRFVKLQHAYPGPSGPWLANATAALGHPPRSWAEYRSTISGYASVLDNAEWVGGYYSRVSASAVILIASAAAIGLALYVRRRR